MARLISYLLVAAPVAASWAGLVDGTGAALFSYLLLLLGVASICLSMLPPGSMIEHLQGEDSRAEPDPLQRDDEDGGVVVPDSGTLAWSGYLLVAAPVVASWAGVADEPVQALLAYVLMLLGVAFIVFAMLFAPAKLKTV